MLLTKEVEVIPSGKNIQYYKDRGYDVKYHKPLTVKVEDLQRGSGVYVNILCDYCRKEIVSIMYKDYIRRIEKYGNSVCINCKPIKTKENNLKKYGTPSPSSLLEIKEKIKNTNLEKWGFKCTLQNKDVRKKAIETCRKNYNVDYSIQSREVFKKTKISLFEHYGVDNPIKSPEIREKIIKTLYANSSQKTSRQQSYLFNLYKSTDSSTELNYPISRFNADICLPNEKIDIEVDFGGHNLQVKIGKLTQEEFNQKEIIRNNIIKKEGYKIMRIISRKDYLPQDAILLQMLQEARHYFQTTSHSWITYDIDKSLLFNAENKQGIPYDYGKLRKIKDGDIATIKDSDLNTIKDSDLSPIKETA